MFYQSFIKPFIELYFKKEKQIKKTNLVIVQNKILLKFNYKQYNLKSYIVH